jgi:thiol-disulfide isomerase/thioredoxin
LIQKLVGSNFKSMVIDSQYDCIVLFDGVSCSKCKVMYHLYLEVAKKLKNNARIRFFVIDTSKNDGAFFTET